MRRRRMSGNTYGPTYAVTSSSSGRSSPSGSVGSSLTRVKLSVPDRFQLLVAGTQIFGHHPDLGDAGHEVRVAAPPGQHVHVEMVRDARTGGAADVDPEIEAIGAVGGPDRPQRADLGLRDRQQLALDQVLEARDVTRRR